MPYKVAIRKNDTGEIRIAEMTDIDWHKWSHFWWTEGNFSCDCNRDLVFERAGGVEPNFDDVTCGNGKYTVLYAELSDGTKITIDKEPTCPQST